MQKQVISKVRNVLSAFKEIHDELWLDDEIMEKSV